jgi:hypothetical protein
MRVGCPAFRRSPAVSRRGFVQAGVPGCAGLTLSNLLRLRAASGAAQDVLATVHRHLGIDPTTQHLDRAGRPHPVLPFGTPVDELF